MNDIVSSCRIHVRVAIGMDPWPASLAMSRMASASQMYTFDVLVGGTPPAARTLLGAGALECTLLELAMAVNIAQKTIMMVMVMIMMLM